MTKPIPRDLIYRRRVFDVDVIQLCVRWYVTFRLSDRDLVELMAERGIHNSQAAVLVRTRTTWSQRIAEAALGMRTRIVREGQVS